MSIFLFINSNDREYSSDTSPNHFHILMRGMYNDYPKIAVSLENITFYNLEYGINSNNNTLLFREDGNDAKTYTATITAGNYNTTDFCTALATAMGTAGTNVYSATYSPITGKITITCVLPDTFKIVGGTLLNDLGFIAQTSFAAGSTGVYPINLAGTTYVDLCMNLYCKNQKTGRNYGRVFARIPVDKPYGSLITWVNASDTDNITLSGDQLDELYIDLFDDKGNPFDLPKNATVSITLRVQTML